MRQSTSMDVPRSSYSYPCPHYLLLLSWDLHERLLYSERVEMCFRRVMGRKATVHWQPNRQETCSGGGGWGKWPEKGERRAWGQGINHSTSILNNRNGKKNTAALHTHPTSDHPEGQVTPLGSSSPQKWPELPSTEPCWEPGTLGIARIFHSKRLLLFTNVDIWSLTQW